MVMAFISFQPILHHDEDYGDLLKGIEMILHTQHTPLPSIISCQRYDGDDDYYFDYYDDR